MLKTNQNHTYPPILNAHYTQITRSSQVKFGNFSWNRKVLSSPNSTEI